MRSIKINETNKVVRQEVLDINKNILLRLYQLESGQFGFRFISYLNGKEIDPVKHSELTWAYGPIKQISETRHIALQFYKSLLQK